MMNNYFDVSIWTHGVVLGREKNVKQSVEESIKTLASMDTIDPHDTCNLFRKNAVSCKSLH